MSIEQILIDLMAIGVIAYAWKCLPKTDLRILFIVAFALLAFYKVYDPDTAMRSMLWGRHLPVYVGEVLFYLFITRLCRHYIEIEDAPTHTTIEPLGHSLAGIVPLATFGTGFSWYQYLTDQGLPHIFALPIFVLILSLVRLRLAIFRSPYVRVVQLFTAAAGAWIMIHVSEFVIESQKAVPGLDDSMAHIEFFWYLTGIIIFCVALKSFHDLQILPKAIDAATIN